MILDGISRHGAHKKVQMWTLKYQYYVMLSFSVTEISVGNASEIQSFLCTERRVVLNKNGATKASLYRDISATE